MRCRRGLSAWRDIRIIERTSSGRTQPGISQFRTADRRGSLRIPNSLIRSNQMVSKAENMVDGGTAREDGGGVQTVKTVVDVLTAFVGAEATPMLKTVAERAGMHPAKVHRYLVSLCKTGHVHQEPGSGRYRLGPSTLRLGYAAM